MPKTAVVTARIEPELKKNTESILKQLGLTTSQAISLYFKQITFQRAIPISLQLPPEPQNSVEFLQSMSGIISSGHSNTTENINELVAESILQKYTGNTP